MEESDRRGQNNHPVPRQHRRSGRVPAEEKFEWSARSCAAATIADCVAVCCCPCAVVSFAAFALVRVPWAVGRRCFAAGKRKWKKRRAEIAAGNDGKSGVVSSRGGWWTEEGIMDISSEARGHDERVWSELCQLGHLGFGRVSFTGISPQVKSNPN